MIYKYKAISQDGQFIKGTYEGDSEKDVLNMLRNKEYIPISIKKDIRIQYKNILFSKKVKRKDLAIFCRQFYTMINAGISIVKSLNILIEQTENKVLKQAIKFIYEDIQKGYTLSQSMGKQKRIFPEILINMIQAGEFSGTLDIVLERMSIHFEKESKLENKIKSAMIYPTILVFSSIAVIIFMLMAVLPTFVSIFTSSGILLPWPTRFILNISIYFQNYWYILLMIIIFIVGLIYYYKNTVIGKQRIDNIKLKIPGIRIISINIITSRFTRTLSTLISSGISLLDALTIVGKILNNREIESRLIKEVESIKRGVSLSTTIENIGIFPPIVNTMINIGEKSGSLDEMLYKAADFYDEEVESDLHKLTTLIEPILLIIMSVIIGFLVIAMTLPMFDMVNII